MSAAVPVDGLPAYVAVTTNGGSRVVLPAGAAGRSRFLHCLLEGLHVLHHATAVKHADSNGASDSHATEDKGTSVAWVNSQSDLYTSLLEKRPQLRPSGDSASGPDPGASTFAGGGEEDFICYARAYPSFYRSATATALATEKRVEATVSDDTAADGGREPSPLLEVPLLCLDGGTAVRMAEFLVQKACASVQPHHASDALKVDPLKDLDCASETDQLVAIHLLLGSDLLGC